MTDHIRVNAEAMHRIADRHDEVADIIATAREAGSEVDAAVSTYGPIMYRVKAATGELLARRQEALAAHGETHRCAAVALRRDAAGFAAIDETNAERIRGVE